VLPGNLDWGASIPNPGGAKVEIENAHGIVCWDVKDKGPAGCGGPEAGLTVESYSGRTWFSVKGHGSNLKENEGFYEFDVKITASQ
jgi:hypothetical protein